MKSVLIFKYGSESLEYHLVLEERKTIAATVFPSSELLVKAPVDATVEGIEAFLARKFGWVLKQKRYFSGFKQSTHKQYLSGETFRYRGRSYKLLLHGNCDTGRVSLQHGVLNVFLEGEKTSESARRLVEKWYSESAVRVFPERVRACSALFGLDEPPVVVQRKMNRRWGSYSKKHNRVTLNRELIKVATRFIDYVVVHELCHVFVEKHNTVFYSLLESKLPDWKQLKTELELYMLGGN